MKRILTGIFAISCLLIAQLQAQSVEDGVKAYDNGDYKGAVVALDKAIATGSLKEKGLARAHYYRGQSKVVLVRKNKTDVTPEMSKLLQNWAVTGYEDLALAKKNDVDGKLTDAIQSATKEMQQLVLDLADAHLLATSDGAKSEAEKKVLWQNMVALCEPVIAQDKFNYRAYDLAADAQLSLRDSLKALKNYHFADDWFFRSAPKDGDMAIAYTYIHIAELEWALNKNYDGALKAIEEGKQVLDGESKKIQSLGNRPPAEKAYLSKRHDIILTDLKKVEMDLKAAAGK
ncbi:MAG: hypothetical protein RLZZ519_2080 [Bacteroidota bacterium]